MSTTLFDDDSSLTPLPQRILLHFKRYKVSFIEAIVVAALTGPQRVNSEELEAVKTAIEVLCDRGILERLSGDSFFSRSVVFLAGHTPKATDVALTYFCFMERERSHLVTYQELKPLFAAENLPSPFHNYRHVLTNSGGIPALSRVYHCKAAKKNAREQIRRHLTEHSRGFSQWLDEGSYQLSVLVTSDGRKEQLKQVISETYRTSPPLRDFAGITVSVVPTEETFERMIKDKV